MLCPGCGNEIEAGEPCAVCAAAEDLLAQAGSQLSRLCRGCGNEIYGEGACPVCAAMAERCPQGPQTATCPECGTQVEDPDDCPTCRAEWEYEKVSFRFCPGCGNEVPDDRPCQICAEAQRRRKASSEPQTHLCPACGNEVYGDGPCGVCSLGRVREKKSPLMLSLCPTCGNEVEDIRRCPICQQGRSLYKGRELDPICPKCADALAEEDWDGARVLVCPTCQGCLFAPGALETALDKLRASMEGQSLPAVLAEFRDRYKKSGLPMKVQYKSCPMCGLSMTRRNYAGISGVIVDVCGRHGTWVDQHAFGDLTDFVTKGGDTLAQARQHRRRR